MTRWLVIIGILLLAAMGLFILLQPSDSQPESTARPAPLPQTASTEEGPTLIVMVDGEERTGEVQMTSGGQLSHLPASQLTASMVSHISGSGGLRTLVLTDGSSMILDDWTIRQLPDDVAFRIGYGRE